MKKEIESLKTNPKLLLHVCCAPCSSAVLERLQDFEITLFYNNPNTYPKEEYDLRANQFAKLTHLPFVKSEYDHNEFLTLINNDLNLINEKEGGNRCQKCIELRLSNSFKYAKENGYDYVTTTLTISPHKDAEYINQLGEKLQSIYNVKFLHSDFKKDNGFLNSVKISTDLGLYRQDYCGCEFSKRN